MIRPFELLPGNVLGRVRSLVHDDDELGIAPCEPHLDAARRKLGADLGRRLAQKVEEAEMQRRGERLAHPASGFGGCLVPETGCGGEILLDRLDVHFQLHRDSTMTSLSMPVKHHFRSHRATAAARGARRPGFLCFQAVLSADPP